MLKCGRGHVDSKCQHVVDLLVVAAHKLLDVLAAVGVPKAHRLVLEKPQK